MTRKSQDFDRKATAVSATKGCVDRQKKTSDDNSPEVYTSAGRAPLLERPYELTGTGWLRPGDPVAPGRYRLVLLPFGPDTIHRLPPHRTQPSTLPGPAVPARRRPSKGNSTPPGADFGFKAPLAPRLARPHASYPIRNALSNTIAVSDGAGNSLSQQNGVTS